MSQEKTKPNHANKSRFKSFEAVNKVEKEALNMGRQTMEKAMNSSDKFNRMATECADICSGNINAYVESGNVSSHNLQKIGNEMVESWNRLFTDFTELSQKAASCRNVGEAFSLHQKAGESMLNKCFHEAHKISGMFFDGYNRAMKPLSEHNAITNKRISKAFAA